MIGVRRKIAQKMQEAKRRIPHFTYVEEVDVTELEDLRARLNAKGAGQRPKLTLLPFVIRAVVRGVREFPQVNARFDDDAGIVTRYRSVHVGIATQTDVGLMVPVLRHAEALDLWQSAAEVSRLAEGARGGKMSRDELLGSTITITSLGALGGIVTTPVINHPEVAIVGVNRIVERPMSRLGRGGAAPADEPVVVVRPSHRRRHRRGPVRAGLARLPRGAGDAFHRLGRRGRRFQRDRRGRIAARPCRRSRRLRATPGTRAAYSASSKTGRSACDGDGSRPRSPVSPSRWHVFRFARRSTSAPMATASCCSRRLARGRTKRRPAAGAAERTPGAAGRRGRRQRCAEKRPGAGPHTPRPSAAVVADTN